MGATSWCVCQYGPARGRVLGRVPIHLESLLMLLLHHLPLLLHSLLLLPEIIHLGILLVNFRPQVLKDVLVIRQLRGKLCPHPLRRVARVCPLFLEYPDPFRQRAANRTDVEGSAVNKPRRQAGAPYAGAGEAGLRKDHQVPEGAASWRHGQERGQAGVWVASENERARRVTARIARRAPCQAHRK